MKYADIYNIKFLKDMLFNHKKIIFLQRLWIDLSA